VGGEVRPMVADHVLPYARMMGAHHDQIGFELINRLHQGFVHVNGRVRGYHRLGFGADAVLIRLAFRGRRAAGWAHRLPTMPWVIGSMVDFRVRVSGDDEAQ